MPAASPSPDDAERSPQEPASAPRSLGKRWYFLLSLLVGVPIVVLVVVLALSVRDDAGPEDVVRAYVSVIDDENCAAIDDLVRDDAAGVSMPTAQDCEQELEQWEDTLTWWAADDTDAAYGFDVRSVSQIDDPQAVEFEDDPEAEQTAVRAVVGWSFSAGSVVECGEDTTEFLLERGDDGWLIVQEELTATDRSLSDC